jgi:glycerol transport system ATP-binding protein
VYQRPADLTTARVFSDPPINTAPVVKRGARIEISDVAGWNVGGELMGLADGAYTLGLRPHHVQPAKPGVQTDAQIGVDVDPVLNGVRVRGQVSVAEISGSESVVHFDLHGLGWMSQSHGVHRFAVGATADFRLDVAHAFYFDVRGRCVSAGDHAMALR